MTTAPAVTAASRPFGALRAHWRQRVRRWWDARLARSDTQRLDQGNIYILPTRAGLLFALTLIVLLLSSINYQLNLGYLLTFLLAGSGLVSMHVTHNTLRGLTLHLRPTVAVHSGDAAPLEVVVTSPSTARHGVGLRVDDDAATPTFTWVDVPAGGQVNARLSFVAPPRGVHPVPTLLIETRFPLGLFRAWSLWRPAAQVTVYPRLETPPPALPAGRSTGARPGTARRTADGGETEGVRAYRRGDPLRLVVWKKVAKYTDSSGELISRDTSAALQEELWLDFRACGVGGTEERLSRLATWVIQADARNATYGLSLPGAEMAPGNGEAHRRACLERLATWA